MFGGGGGLYVNVCACMLVCMFVSVYVHHAYMCAGTHVCTCTYVCLRNTCTCYVCVSGMRLSPCT